MRIIRYPTKFVEAYMTRGFESYVLRDVVLRDHGNWSVWEANSDARGLRFGNIEGREGEPCRMINFRSRSCYTLDLTSHHDDTRSMRFCAYYYVVTTSQPVGGEKRRYPRIRETKGSRSWIRKCVVSNFAFSSSRILWRTLVLQSRGNLIIGRHFTSAAA